MAEKIRSINKKIYIIFETAHLEYLLLAYKYKTFDYLPKPISLSNLESTISRLFNDIGTEPLKKSFIKLSNGKLINSNSIFYIEKDNMKLIFRADEEDYSIYSSFNKIQPKLPTNFVRCHKSYIVNVNNIKHINNSIIHFDKTGEIKCYIGQVYRKKFLEVLKHESYTNTNDT